MDSLKTNTAAPAIHPPSGELRLSAPLPRLAVPVLVVLCAAKLLLHIFTSVRHYGYFRDELYYLDMARHLDWGYVDAAPLIAVYAKVALLLGGGARGAANSSGARWDGAHCAHHAHRA